jgi:hypothetical protein
MQNGVTTAIASMNEARGFYGALSMRRSSAGWTAGSMPRSRASSGSHRWLPYLTGFVCMQEALLEGAA